MRCPSTANARFFVYCLLCSAFNNKNINKKQQLKVIISLFVLVVLYINPFKSYAETSFHNKPVAAINWEKLSDNHFLTGNSLNFSVKNNFHNSIDFTLVVHSMAQGKLITMPLVNDSLQIRENKHLSFPLLRLEELFKQQRVNLNKLNFSGNFYLEATLHHNEKIMQRAYSPTIFFHKETGLEESLANPLYAKLADKPNLDGVFFSYTRDFRETFLNKGNLYNKKYDLIKDFGTKNLQGVISGGQGLIVNPDQQTNGIPTIDDVVDNSNELKVCFSYDFQTADSGGGEDYYWGGNKMTAHGIFVMVQHLNWPGYFKFLYADPSSGCIQFTTPEQNGNKDYKFYVFAHHQIGGYWNDPRKILINGFANKDDFNNKDMAYWIIDDFDPGKTSGQVFITIEPSDLGNAMASATYSAWHMDLLSRLSSDHEIAIDGGNQNLNIVIRETEENELEEGYASYCNYYCGGLDVPREDIHRKVIFATAEKAKYKFVMAHELGHFLQDLFGALLSDLSFSIENSLSPNCSYDGIHSMFSMEWQYGAWNEGFAYFISALAWNNQSQENGIVRYFKPIQAPNLNLADYNHTLFLNLQEKNWLETICQNEISENGGNVSQLINGKSTEYDWMRFYWNYLTASLLNEDENNMIDHKPTVAQIFQQIKGFGMLKPYLDYDISDQAKAFKRLRLAMDDNCAAQENLIERWNFLGEAHGVDNSAAAFGWELNDCIL